MSLGRASGRHAAAGPPRGRAKGVAALAVGAVLVGSGAWWITHRGPAETTSAPGTTAVAAGPCTGSAPVRLATLADYRALADAMAAAYTAKQVSVDGVCSTATVQIVTPGELAQVAAAADPPAAFLTGPLQTSILAAAAESKAASLGTGQAIARSVSVVAVTAPVAAATGWGSKPPTWASIGAGLLDPTVLTKAGHPELAAGGLAAAHPAGSAASASAVAAIIAAAQGAQAPDRASVALMTSEPAERAMIGVVARLRLEGATEQEVLTGLLAADKAGTLVKTVAGAFVDERVVHAYNAAKPSVPLQAIYPSDGNLVGDLTLTPVASARLTGTVRAGLTSLLSLVTGEAGRPIIEGAGYRPVVDTPSTTLTAAVGLSPTPPSKRLNLPDPLMRYAMSSGWDLLHNPGRYLFVLDVSTSMLQRDPGTGKTKLQLAQEAGVSGLSLMPGTGEIGLWVFSRNMTGTAPYRELVPVGLAGDDLGGKPRSQAFVEALQGTRTGAFTALYRTVLAAHASMVAGYKPNETNMILLVTDGRNEDPGSPTLEQTVASLKAQSDLAKPVVVYTIAFGANADLPALEAIAKATGGKSYAALEPKDLGKVVFAALVGGALVGN